MHNNVQVDYKFKVDNGITFSRFLGLPGNEMFREDILDVRVHL